VSRRLAALIAAVLGTVSCLATTPVDASPREEYTGTHFGANNMPPGCERDSLKTFRDNACYHMRSGLNGLDSPQVDVLILVPLSPTAERDMRIMRQAVEMWEAGIHNLAPQMGLHWLGDGMQFHVVVDVIDLTGKKGGEFTTYPIVDPEIVVIASNPIGAAGIGVDPVATVGGIFGRGDTPCTGLRNPFDLEAWQALPGFDSHHEARSGTYVEDCAGAGGNICFAVNSSQDPAPRSFNENFNLFDLVAHEFGHCLTLGHVGDGAEGPWAKVPTNDIMAYSDDPVGLNKCVSTLDVETVATRMSRYLDVNRDRKVTAADLLLVNDQPGDGMNSFQTQHPRDHWYASSTGNPAECPQPDLGLFPGARTNWEPDPVGTDEPVLTITDPSDGRTALDGTVIVAGAVSHLDKSRPTKAAAHVEDEDNDGRSAATEITSVDVEVKPSTLEATIHLENLPRMSVTSASTTAYSVTVNGRRFDSFVRLRPLDGGPLTWDTGRSAYMPRGSSTWDANANTVTFHLPHDYLRANGVLAPLKVSSRSHTGSTGVLIPDDQAPNANRTIGVTSARMLATSGAVLAAESKTVNFTRPGGNTFKATDSDLGFRNGMTAHKFTLDVPEGSDVSVKLEWKDTFTELDLAVTGSAATNVRTSGPPETVDLTKAKGRLEISVIPFIVPNTNGVSYTLSAVIGPKSARDGDGDGVADDKDVCLTIKGDGADGCPIKAYERIHLYVDGVKTAVQTVDTANGPDRFGIMVELGPGTHTLKLDWEAFGKVLTSESVKVSRPLRR